MHLVLRILAALAIVLLLVGVPELVTGLGEAARQDGRARIGLREIPRDSEFVRSLMAAPLQDDLGGVNRKRRDAPTPLRRMRQQRSCGEVSALMPPSFRGPLDFCPNASISDVGRGQRRH